MRQLAEEPKSYTGIYSMHKYWSKKLYNVIARYIKKYTNPGDIVLDPFSGSGISCIESVLSKRRAIGIDINPISTFITRQVLADIDICKMEQEFQCIKKDIHDKVDGLYEILIHDKPFIGTHFIYDEDILTEIWYKDHGTKKTINADNKGLKTKSGFSYRDIETFVPDAKMIKNSRINARDGMPIYDLFTPRNTLALSVILDRIDKISDKVLRDFFRFCFTSCSGQASKMVFVVNNRGKMQGRTTPRKEVGSWVVGYWTPREHFEINAWNCFENRYKRTTKAKKEFAKMQRCVNHVGSFADLKHGNIWLINDNCYDILRKLPDSSVDYVITDPPHGNRLPYLELSMMWNSWLRFDVNMEDEFVVSDAKARNKTVSEYVESLERILAEVCRVLKDDLHFTLMFNSYDGAVWTRLQEILFHLDLELSDAGTVGYSAGSVIQDSRRGGLRTDFIFTFRKKISKDKGYHTADKSTIDSLVSDCLARNGNSQIYELLNHVIIGLVRKRLIFDMALVMSSVSSRWR